MPFSLHNLRPAAGSSRPRTRVGRGISAGGGKTAGRGTKGQRARTGGKKGLRAFSLRRITNPIPKRKGFTSRYIKPEVINVGILERAFDAGAEVNPMSLDTKGLIRHPERGVKILGEGNVTKPYKIVGCTLSKSARVKILAAGGSVT